MSTPSGIAKHDRQLDLMQLHDGELTDDEDADLTALDADEAAVLDGLEQLGDVLRAHVAEQAKDAGDVVDQVMARIDDEPAPEVEAAKPRVERIDRGKAPPPRSKVAPVVAIGLALAAAAAWALWPKPGVDTTTRPAPVAKAPEERPVEPPVAQLDPPVEPGDDDGPPAASIEAVDFGNRAGTIFMVPAGEESTPVVWLVDEPAGGRMERL